MSKRDFCPYCGTPLLTKGSKRIHGQECLSYRHGDDGSKSLTILYAICIVMFVLFSILSWID